ncbi:folylpolyglutamate synthase/dihydrofolate synthase family protein [Pontibacter saemangeumensis]|uniref:Dihydrofolate synthase/folylpolyglutamate synthase n=2 Tax=Pontibacter saemangeumensis TaxID=1084525 RepID=A0ABP8LF15_9BACT
MFHRIGNAAFKKTLHNTIALCEALGQPQQQFKTIHVAGTNGKGSSSHMLAAVLQESGYKTGLYTSPHLKSFTERIRINGQELPEAYLVQFVAEHKPLFERIQPSFFEMTVALAFKYFAEEQVDVAVIEVGLGGRLDSTNIIHPDISLITNIGYDHEALLGNTISAIASEKAGIIKPGVPAVISTRQLEAQEVFEARAEEAGAPLFFAPDQFRIEVTEANLERQVMQVYRNEKSFLPGLELDLAGNYQKYNLPGVLLTLVLLHEKGYHITHTSLRSGLANVKALTGLKGRWQVLNHLPLTICDTGHNEDGIKQVLKQLEGLKPKQVHMVFGAVNDKDITAILHLLPKRYRYYFCQAIIPRALPVQDLYAKAQGLGLEGAKFYTVSEAVAAAKANAAPDEVIFIGGSTFVVAEIEEL